MSNSFTTRPARVEDAPAIFELINEYAERNIMLHRSMESLYESLRDFIVAQDADGRIIGCVALDIFWADLAEIKSLAAAPDARGQGVGYSLLAAAVGQAGRLGIGKLFALTYEQEFFARQGFDVIDRNDLPEKVWRECIACPKVDNCDEIAMMRIL